MSNARGRKNENPSPDYVPSNERTMLCFASSSNIAMPSQSGLTFATLTDSRSIGVHTSNDSNSRAHNPTR